MSSSVFALTEDLRPRMATGYQVRRYEDSPGIAPDVPLNVHTAAGQLYSTVADLAKWIALQFRTEVAERFLSPMGGCSGRSPGVPGTWGRDLRVSHADQVLPAG